jgi:tetratricopeptide (TPR) repeat protein
MADIDEGTLFKYSVFISYSRKDIDFARKLEDALEAYRPPRHLPVPRRSLRVFRDESDFTGSEYSAALDRNLRDASKLLVICSPNSRASKAVNQEVERFASYRGAENIVPVLLAGVPNNNAKPEQEEQKAFPESLVRLLPVPLAADFRGFDAQRERFGGGSFESAWYKTLADVYSDFRVTRDQIAGAEARRRVQRRNTAIAAGASLVLVLSVLTGWALVERRDAVRQRDEVRQREDRLLEAINHVTYEFPNELRALNPAPAVLEATYRNNYKLLKDLFDKGIKGPMLDLPMAANVLNLADIWTRQGKLDDALTYARMIPDRNQELSPKESADQDWQDRLSLAHGLIGDVSLRQGDLKTTEEQYQEAFRIRSEVLGNKPANSQRWQHLLALIQQAMCGFELERAGFGPARRNCRDALQGFEILARQDESRTDGITGVIWTRLTLADIAEQQGSLPEMLEHLAAAGLAIERERDRGDRRLETVALHERRGEALLAMHDHAGALAEASQALRLGEEFAKYADDADGRRNFAILRHDIASIYRDTGRHSDAARQFAVACAEFDALLGLSSGSLELQRLHALCTGDAGEARLLAGDVQGALNDLSRALAMQQDLAGGSVDHPGRQLELATCHRQLGDWYAQRGAHPTALDQYQRALRILAPLAAKVPEYRTLQQELASVQARIGAAQRAARDPAALESYRDAMVRYRKLVDHDPTNARWKKGLTETSIALAALQPASGPRQP